MATFINTIVRGDMKVFEHSSDKTEINWNELNNDLVNFIKINELDSMKKVAEDALIATQEKDESKLRKILVAGGKTCLEIFSKVSGTVLSEMAKNLIFPVS